MALASEIKQVLESLNEATKKGYGPTCPGPLDLQFASLAEYYSLASESEREEIRAGVRDESRSLILGFSDRLSVLAARSGDERYVFLALLAHAIEDFSYDPRENLVRLALVNHVAERLGMDTSSLFRRAGSLASEEAAARFASFVKRPPALKSLKAMKIREVMTDEGVDYRPS